MQSREFQLLYNVKSIIRNHSLNHWGRIGRAWSHSLDEVRSPLCSVACTSLWKVLEVMTLMWVLSKHWSERSQTLNSVWVQSSSLIIQWWSTPEWYQWMDEYYAQWMSVSVDQLQGQCWPSYCELVSEDGGLRETGTTGWQICDVS